jgi:hypothetical protein
MTLIVRFYNAYELRNVPAGHRYFRVGTIGYKWVKIKESHAPHWKRISLKKWQEIQQLNTFKIIREG